MTRLSRILLTLSTTCAMAYLVFVRREAIAVPMLALVSVLAWCMVDWWRSGDFQDWLTFRGKVEYRPIKNKEWLDRVLTYSQAHDLREWRRSIGLEDFHLYSDEQYSWKRKTPPPPPPPPAPSDPPGYTTGIK